MNAPRMPRHREAAYSEVVEAITAVWQVDLLPRHAFPYSTYFDAVAAGRPAVRRIFNHRAEESA